jgi:translation initiation factor 1
MKKNLFEIGAKFDEVWSSDNLLEKTKLEHETKEPHAHRLIFTKEKRKGKVVTIVKPFFLNIDELEKLISTLKKRLSRGGTIKENTLEFQGEVQEALKAELLTLGYKFK